MTDLIIKMPKPRDCVCCPMAHWNRLDEFTGCGITPGKRYAVVQDKAYAESDCPPDWCPIEGELVRCCDCRHRGFLRRVSQSDPLEEIVDFPDGSRCPLAAGGLIMPDDFFCGRGERRVQSGDDER